MIMSCWFCFRNLPTLVQVLAWHLFGVNELKSNVILMTFSVWSLKQWTMGVWHRLHTFTRSAMCSYTRRECLWQWLHTVYPKKYAHGFVVLCFVVVMQSFIMNSHEVFIHIHQGCFAGTGAIVRLPQCQWSKPDGYGKISQCITTTKHSKAKTVCIFLGIYCIPTREAMHACDYVYFDALRMHTSYLPG